jgi:hypothetical protein
MKIEIPVDRAGVARQPLEDERATAKLIIESMDVSHTEKQVHLTLVNHAYQKITDDGDYTGINEITVACEMTPDVLREIHDAIKTVLTGLRGY